jgi:hypothetical protein
MSEETKKLFTSKLRIITVGIESFADALREQGADVEHVEWRPIAGGDKELADLLKKMGEE